MSLLCIKELQGKGVVLWADASLSQHPGCSHSSHAAPDMLQVSALGMQGAGPGPSMHCSKGQQGHLQVDVWRREEGCGTGEAVNEVLPCITPWHQQGQLAACTMHWWGSRLVTAW